MPAAGVRGAGAVPLHVLRGAAGAALHPVSVGPHQRGPGLQRLREGGVRQRLRASGPAANGGGDHDGPLEPVHQPRRLLSRPVGGAVPGLVERPRGSPTGPHHPQLRHGPPSAGLPPGDVPEAARGLLPGGQAARRPFGGLQRHPGRLLRVRGRHQRQKGPHLPGGRLGGLSGRLGDARQHHRGAVAAGARVHQSLLAGPGRQPGGGSVRVPVRPRVGPARPDRQAPHLPPPPGRLAPLLDGWRRRVGAGAAPQEPAVAVHAVLLRGGDGAHRHPGAAGAVRAELAAVLGPGAHRLRVGGAAPGLPEQPAGAAAHAALPGGPLGGVGRPGLQRRRAGGVLRGRLHPAHVHRLRAVFPLHGRDPRDQVKAVEAGGPIRTRGPVRLRRLCGELVLPGGQRRLQRPLPGHAALHEGLPLPARRRHPPRARWNHRSFAVLGPEERTPGRHGVLTGRLHPGVGLAVLRWRDLMLVSTHR
ncbi:proton-coupled folate transporter isoform X2 [Pseudoliparis swirei]|uniref:proton-coupled folate transporter isoform X2 n=1 Tax=Pseudoliparis swirei TaxID=2059687 RepID=UPI0024BE11A5|nr:proton-coupled folate transporter isoform X2 [Pseudoliparis swirei]